MAPEPSEEPSASPTTAPRADLLIGLDPTGTFLVTPEGFALYTFDDDLETMGDSRCEDDCVAQWPPLEQPVMSDVVAGEGVTGDFFPILRGDGVRQVTYNDLPLYTYVGDEAPGETNGDGLGGVWHLATPESCHTVIGCDE
jgi:predicted lipoprotein with Yx(FWY)xxD motif